MTIVYAKPPKRSPPRKKRPAAKPVAVIVSPRKGGTVVRTADDETSEGVKEFFRRMIRPPGTG